MNLETFKLDNHSQVLIFKSEKKEGGFHPPGFLDLFLSVVIFARRVFLFIFPGGFAPRPLSLTRSAYDSYFDFTIACNVRIGGTSLAT